jgi:O-glycosyl hydrolase
MRMPCFIVAAMLGVSLCVRPILGAQDTAASQPSTRPVTHTLQVDFSKQQQPFLGWGTSLCWWAHGVGGWDERTIDEVVHLVADSDTGLGMNVFRYNIGGGDDPTHHHMRQWGDVPGYKSSPDAAYDWAADANQRRLLSKLVAARSDAIVEAFSNSPPFWMTRSGCSAGAVDGQANLPQERESDFVRYLVNVASHFREAYGVTFHSIDPFNEPDVNWWRADKGQEGCHIPRDQQARLITQLRAQLDQAGLASTLVSATDANSIDDAAASVGSYDQLALSALGQINAHSYAGSRRSELHELAVRHEKPLWQSETGPLWVGGTPYEQMLKVAERLTLDVNQMRPQVWCTWQVVAGGEWGCLNDDMERRQIHIGKMFHVLASFTRHIRPGDRFVEVQGDCSAIGAVSAARSEAVVVLVNRAKQSARARITLTGLTKLPTTVHVSRVSATEDTVAQPASLRDGTIEIDVPAESVLQLLLPDISM